MIASPSPQSQKAMKATGFLPYLQTGWYDTERAHLSLNSTSKETVISEQAYPQPLSPSREPGDPSAICPFRYLDSLFHEKFI